MKTKKGSAASRKNPHRKTNLKKHVSYGTIIIGVIAGIYLLGVGGFKSNAETVNQLTGEIETPANLKVAFIGDTENSTNFINVLNLIKAEGAQAVFHQGDFDYAFDADGFFATIDSVLGPTFPYFASVGNHDKDSWSENCTDPDGCYATFLKNRMAAIGVTPDSPDLNDYMYSIDFQGLKAVFVGQSGVSTGNNTYAPYIQSQLENDNHVWKICSWHKNQNAMQIGTKTDGIGWNVYENCKNNGAIIATAHEHSYERTKTLTSMQFQVVDTTCTDNPNTPQPDVCVAKGNPGKSFAFVSGLGGRDPDPQSRCLPTTYPYGCNGEWASVYTTSQGVEPGLFGALFITFNVDGDPRKAKGEYKNVSGQVIDSFDIVRLEASTSTPNLPPIANAGPDQTANVSDVVTLNGASSADPDGVITSYNWNFGDGQQTTGAIVTHAYQAPGSYLASLMVVDNSGASSTDTALMTINPNSTSTPSSTIAVLTDSFEVSEWNGLWTEDSQNDWLRSNQRAIVGSYSAEVDGSASDAQLISIPINLQGKTNATITFSWFIESALDKGEYVAFDISTDGGTTWVEKARIKGNVDQEDVWQNISVNATNINNLRLRFRGKMSGSSEDADVDNVNVVAF